MKTDNEYLAGKTALITGAAKRLGAATALALAHRGANLVLHYNTSAEPMAELARQASALGVKVWTLSADLADVDAAAVLFPRAVEAAGPIDFLINNAAVFPDNRLADLTPDDLYGNININALAPLLIARCFAAQQRPGAIVNFLDTRIVDADKRHAAYHLSKRMLFTLTRMMALEFAPGVRVNAVAPGLILPPPGEDEDYLERLASTNPLGRYGSPHDIAEAVLFLLCSDFITGQVLFVDGGRHLRGSMYGC